MLHVSYFFANPLLAAGGPELVLNYTQHLPKIVLR